MRIGGFWGLTAPMAILVFDGDYDTLYEYLTEFNHCVNRHSVLDLKKEFIYLKNCIDWGEWKLPEFESVSESFDGETVVRNLQLPGATELQNVLFLREVCYKVIGTVLKFEERGVYAELPAELQGWVMSELGSKEFKLGKLNSTVRASVKGAKKAQNSCIEQWANAFGLKKVQPETYWWNDEKREYNEDQKKTLNYFRSRLDVVENCILRCSNDQQEEDKIFGWSFFDLIKRKPISIKYSVLSVFQRVKDKTYAKDILNCRDQCRSEIGKFKDGLQENVDLGDGNEVEIVSSDEWDQILNECSESARDFFQGLVRSEVLKLQDFRKKDLEMIINIYNKIETLESVGVDTKLKVKVKDFYQFTQDCVEAGIVGINGCSFELFADSIANISFTDKSKIKKSPEELEELGVHLHDVDALLDTIIPIGTSLEGQHE